MNPSPSTCIGGAVPCTDLQASDLMRKDTPHYQGFYLVTKEEHQKQDSKQVGRDATPTKYSRKSIRAGK